MIAAGMPKPPSSVDAYLASLPADKQAALGRLRTQVASLVPEAVEVISYGIPTFKLDGKALIWYAAWKSHCSIYPLTDAFAAAHPDVLKEHGGTKGSLHFTPANPLPEPLIAELVRERVADVGASRA